MMPPDLDPTTLAAIAGAFLLAGTVKGVVGFGMPTVSLAVLAGIVGLPQAMALLLVPSLVTNVQQALTGGQFRPLIRRLGPLLLVTIPSIWLGVWCLSVSDAAGLARLLGLVVTAYGVSGLAGLALKAPARIEPWASPLIGAVNGLLTGLTGSFVVPGVAWLQALGLDRIGLVQAMGMLFSVSTLALAVAMGSRSLLPAELGLVSALAVVPAVAGMALGMRLRRYLPERHFRRVFFGALVLLGLRLMLS
ncbi:sulfite exporter TauE/SafE family protein [Tistrella bauzanensis]|uniref:Probable membrane transporter protein n=1 Tax=Tistrella arctica TaxID=3133430 RepID=A0ABU9YD05_9PROT